MQWVNIVLPLHPLVFGKEGALKRYVVNLILVITLLIGIGLLLYPSVSSYINQKNQSRVIEAYNDFTNSLTETDTQKMLDAARQYNEKLASTEGAFYSPELIGGYNDILNAVGNGVIGYSTSCTITTYHQFFHSVIIIVIFITSFKI